MSVLATVSAPPLAATGAASIVLRGVSWEVYQALRQPEENNHLRMTYDRGALEIMSPQRKHGKVTTLLDRMIFAWAMLNGVEIESAGNMTCSKKELKKGLEPDLCYWTIHQPEMFGKEDYDSEVDPPPDLALEVDIAHSSIPKLPIYEALRIPEVWRWRKGLEVLRLRGKKYVAAAQSTALRGFPLQVAEEFVQRRDTAGEIALLRQFSAAIAELP
jgi:Uma2 family endonuclease